MSTTHAHSYTPKHTPAPRPNPAHPRPWHREAVFGEGTRRVLSARERDEYANRLRRFVREGLIPSGTIWTGLALRDHLDWKTGQCDPSHALLGQTVRERYCRKRCDRTIQRDLGRLWAVGATTWDQRLIRVGPWRSEQTSNQYQLHPDADGKPRALPIPTAPRPEPSDRIGPRTPWARPVPIPLRQEPSDAVVGQGGADVPLAVRTAEPLSYVGPRRGPGFSDTLSAGSSQPTPPLSPAEMERARAARIAAKVAQEREARSDRMRAEVERIRRGRPGTG